jgi:hypothetical protein
MLTSFRRPHTLAQQLEAVQSQTVKPAHIVIWHNQSDGIKVDEEKMRSVDFVFSSRNLGVWARFLICLEFNTDYIAVFDDDTIPGPKWFENCLKTFSESPKVGLVGSAGVLFDDGTREKRTYVGWSSQNESALPVDICGHAWFFKRELLKIYSQVYRATGPTCGEDYALSFSAQKLDLQTVVPPHPKSDRDLWGSLRGLELGGDDVAMFKTEGQAEAKAEAHKIFKQWGWKTLSEMNGQPPAAQQPAGFPGG